MRDRFLRWFQRSKGAIDQQVVDDLQRAGDEERQVDECGSRQHQPHEQRADRGARRARNVGDAGGGGSFPTAPVCADVTGEERATHCYVVSESGRVL